MAYLSYRSSYMRIDPDGTTHIWEDELTVGGTVPEITSILERIDYSSSLLDTRKKKPSYLEPFILPPKKKTGYLPTTSSSLRKDKEKKTGLWGWMCDNSCRYLFED